jgi:F-type H+-transporting ATPase subunit b
MDIYAVAGDLARGNAVLFAAAEPGAAEPAGFQINLFWVAAQAASFLLLLGILYLVAFRRIGGVLETRRQTIEQGLRDADQARKDREAAAAEHQRVLAEARREANDIVTRAQRVAEESRERDLTEARGELERLRTQAAQEIAAERERALSDIRAEVADLAILAAGRVLRESMDSQRERRIVEEFLDEVGAGRPPGGPSARVVS